METTDQKAYVQTEIHQGIGTITFFHPQRNSLPGQILQSLAHAITEAGADAAVKVILLQSAGEKVFCSGASFDELSALTNEKDGQKFFSGFAHVINAMRKCPKLIIGRIQGKCVGGGVGLAAAVDYAIAMEGADVKLSELAVGIGPFVVGPAVERKLGLSAFSQLAIDASMWRNADWARRKGLYAELHPDQAGMDESIDRLARNLAHMSADAMYEMKKMFWKGTEHWDQLLMDRAAVSGRLILSEQAKGAIAAFKK
jgi:methylglutaconyl-CoA hydratase